ncbi:hypothetical protein [Bacillus sp. KH172YL63]|uniref:hypothetical protein n=1 Tax=Bacillus sp. KH172YL63 TaxID=2709784 RepID=UPI0013E47751|nr:hypothetical protein [Bacillus sp. KH172YL63]BCB02747.1 hypothetical protein KH172YL63_08800 [Bacillus sp. KH172YL63]
MSEKNNPLEGIMDLIKQYTGEDLSKFEAAKDQLSSLLDTGVLKDFFESEGKGLDNLDQLANMMNVLPMVERVVGQRMDRKQQGCHKKDKHEQKGIEKLLKEILDELKHIKKCTCHKKHRCHKEHWEHWY